MEPIITPAPIPRGALLHRRDSSISSSGNSTGAIDTCGYLSGDYATPLTCGVGYTCSTGPSLLPSHLGCCNAVNCAPSSGAHTCITATSGSIPCTGEFSSGCIEEYTSLLFCTDPTAPACITYSQPPPSSGSAADAGFSPTIFSYSCGPTQTTHIYLATATNGPASASTPTPTGFSHLPIGAYVGIGIGGLLVLMLILSIWRKFTTPPSPTSSPRYRCRHCGSINLAYRTVQLGNRNGNAGRRYCVCVNRYCVNVQRTQEEGQHDRGWVSWDDDIGIIPGNPLCFCQRISRLDVAGQGSMVPGKPFWTCSTGACDFLLWQER